MKEMLSESHGTQKSVPVLITVCSMKQVVVSFTGAHVFHASCQVLDLLELSGNSCLSFGKYAMNEKGSDVKSLLKLEGHKGLWAMSLEHAARSSLGVVTHGK